MAVALIGCRQVLVGHTFCPVTVSDYRQARKYGREGGAELCAQPVVGRVGVVSLVPGEDDRRGLRWHGIGRGHQAEGGE